MTDFMLLTFLSAIYCCMLLSCSVVKLVFIGSNDPKLKSKSRFKTVLRWKIIFVTEHVRSNDDEHAPEGRSLPAKDLPLLATSCAAGEYCLVQCVCVCVIVFFPIRFEVFTAVLLKCKVFCDLKPCWLTLKMKALIFWKANNSYHLTWHNVSECLNLSTLGLLKNKFVCVFGRELEENFWNMLLWMGVRMEIMRYASFCIEAMIAYWYSDCVIGWTT